MIFALIGNQNSGKTTLFNQLTGSNQRVGNFPGVTVDRKEGTIKGHKEATVVDLPGIYSLAPYSQEEIITRDFLLHDRPNAIINIVDATNIERNLYLTLQLIELEIPMVLALNMMDEVRSNGNTIDIKGLHDALGIPVIPISAVKNEGITELVDKALLVVNKQRKPRVLDFCQGAVHRTIHAVAHLIEDHAENIKVPRRFAASKLVEGDDIMLEALELSDNEVDMLGHTVIEMETELGMDREAAMADMRYNFIEQLCKDNVVRTGLSKEHDRSVKIDSILTNKYLAIPTFLLIMFTIFWLTFDVIGTRLSDLLGLGIDSVIGLVDQVLTNYELNPLIQSFVVDGVLAGVGSVLTFIPIIVTLFFLLSILEDSGYMARIAFVMDKLLRKIGLSGRSIVPMLIGFGCTVPAIMATRTLSSDRDRKLTILLTPFMSCSAKVPIYAVFTAAFFQKQQALVMTTIYLLGIVIAIITGLILNSTKFKGKPVPFVMELPNYRMPSPKSVALLVWDKAKDFIIRAFTIIFVATIIIWFLQKFDFRFNVVEDSANSMLASLGKLISPFFAPLGFGDWRAATALITGFTAKEAVVSTMAVLMGTNIAELSGALGTVFTPLSAFAFLAFTLLYTPCVAAVAAVRREMGTRMGAFLVILFQTGVAWLIAFIVYNVGKIFGL